MLAVTRNYSTMSEQQPALLVIGGGNMGKAIIAGGRDAGVLANPAFVAVAEPDEARRGHFESTGLAVRGSAADGIAWLRGVERRLGEGQIVLAVKPQVAVQVGLDIRSLLVEPRVVISIMAGKSSEKVRLLLGDNARVVRAMPNLPASVGKGMTALCAGAGAQPGDEHFALRLFAAMGRVERIDESLMDAFTALAGSGPAYLFYLAEAMTRAGVKMGFSPQIADTVARQTLLGASVLLSQAPEAPAVLRGAVTSRGGTTAAAIESLDSRGTMEALQNAILAARDRGTTLANDEELRNRGG
jgi:pyrroline-5-carboxylate reductase